MNLINQFEADRLARKIRFLIDLKPYLTGLCALTAVLSIFDDSLSTWQHVLVFVGIAIGNMIGHGLMNWWARSAQEERNALFPEGADQDTPIGLEVARKET